MDQNIHLLKNVVSSARTGIEAVTMLLEKTNDPALREELLRQKAQYQEVELSAETRLGQLGETPNPKGAMERAGAWIGVNMSTIADKTPSHMADMIIQGNTMGVVEVTRARNACPQADPIARDLADRLIGVSQQGIERAKGFL